MPTGTEHRKHCAAAVRCLLHSVSKEFRQCATYAGADHAPGQDVGAPAQHVLVVVQRKGGCGSSDGRAVTIRM